MVNQDQEIDESLNGQNEYGWTQLHYAAFKGDNMIDEWNFFSVCELRHKTAGEPS